MKEFFKQMLAATTGYIVGSILLFFFGMIIIFGISASAGKKKPVSLKDQSILKLSLTGEVEERSSSNDFPFASMFGDDKGFALDEMIAVIRAAAKDEKIKGIYLDLGMLRCGGATAASIRKELVEFKKSKKFIYAYGEMMTEKTYYLASVADSIFMYPTGMVEWNGMAANPMFYRGMLDRWHVEPKVFKVGKFKSAAESFSEKQLSDMNRLQLQVILNDMWEHIVGEIAQSRKISAKELDSLASNIKVVRPAQAVKYKLIDATMYPDQVEELLRKRTKREKKDKLNWVKYSDYAKNVNIRKDKASFNNKVAVIYAVGEIKSGEGDEETIGSETLCEAIREAREDEGVKAIVLRVNSPGGSALASDVIGREIEITKKVKPVIASYGDVAASGGYYISANCDRIFAEPTTITGSIGVIGLLFNTQGFFNQDLGITFDRVYSSTNQHADIGNPNRPMSEFEATRIQEEVNQIYGEFIDVVKRGRKYPDSVAVDSIAQGRIWSGNRALKLKLVDEIGSLDDAIKAAAKKAGLGEKDYSVAEFPKHKNFFEKIFSGIQTRSETKVIEKYLPKEQLRLFKTLQSFNDPRHVYMREFWHDAFN
jgi:protease-4